MPLVQVIQKLEGVPKWYFGKYSAYEKLKTIDPQGIYYLYDTGNIMCRGKLFNSSTVIYEEGQRPIIGAIDRLYINAKTLEGFVFHNNNWVKILEAFDKAETIDYDKASTMDRINGVAIDPIIHKFFTEMRVRACTSIEWDEENHYLNYRLGTIGHNVEITHLVSRFTFDPKTRIAICYDDQDNVVCETELMDSHVIGGSYDNERKAIILKMRDGSECRLKAQALLNIYKGINTTTATLQVKHYIDGNNIIYCEINNSIKAKNTLQILEDGLYAPKQIDFADMDEGDMFKYSDGYILPNINIKLLATEAFVQQVKDDLVTFFESKGAVWLRRRDVIESFNEVARTDQVPSFRLVNRHCGLRRL